MSFIVDAPRPAEAIRVVVATGATLTCEALVARLVEEDDLHAIAAAGKLASAMAAIRDLNPAVVITDPANDPDFELIEAATSLPHPAGVVAIVSPGDEVVAARALRKGATAVVLKTASAIELIAAIRWVAHGYAWISPPLVRGVLQEAHRQEGQPDERLKHLTSREFEILQLMVDGLGRKQMATHLYLSVDTVRTHMRTIMEKLDVHSAMAAVSVGLAAGLRPRD